MKHLCVEKSKVKKLPNSIWRLKSLLEVRFHSNSKLIDPINSWKLPIALGVLQNLEVLLVYNVHLGCQLPSRIESLPFLRTLHLSDNRISEVPKTVSMLPCLQVLTLFHCHLIQELPALPTSLTHLCVSSASLQIVLDISNLTNLVELKLDDSGEGGDGFCVYQLGGLGSYPN